jgi:hypothetical protein
MAKRPVKKTHKPAATKVGSKKKAAKAAAKRAAAWIGGRRSRRQDIQH